MLPLHNTLQTMALAYDPVDNYVYWTDKTLMIIRRAKLDGSGEAYSDTYVLLLGRLRECLVEEGWACRNGCVLQLVGIVPSLISIMV